MARVISTPITELMEKMSIPEPELEPSSHTLERYKVYIKELETDTRCLNMRIDELLRENQRYRTAYYSVAKLEHIGCHRCGERMKGIVSDVRKRFGM